MKNEIIYYLNIQDVQTVALDELDRKLSLEEIEAIKERIANNIDWYDSIAEAVNHFYGKNAGV
jgi:hypothetical protein